MRPLYKPQMPMPKEVMELIEMEDMRRSLLEFETTAAVYQFLTVAKMTPAEQAKAGVTLQWLYGPVTSPYKRDNSFDDLGGLRLIGHLVFPDGRHMNAIIPVTFYVRKDKGEDGKPGLLFAGDNLRVEIQLYSTDAVRSNFAYQSFSVKSAGDKMIMQPGDYMNKKTGMLANEYITTSALGMSCIDCHSKGPRLKAKHYKLMQEKDYQAMEGFAKYLEQSEHLGATRAELAGLKEQMTADPRLLIPLDDLLKATEEQWIRRFPAYKNRLRTGPNLGMLRAMLKAEKEAS
jgi:hypothetical protein